MAARPSPLDVNWLVLRLSRMHIARALAEHACGQLLDVGCGRKPYSDLQTTHARRTVGLEHDRRRYADTPPAVWGNGQYVAAGRAFKIDRVKGILQIRYIDDGGAGGATVSATSVATP